MFKHTHRLSPGEAGSVFVLDQRINDRGFCVDRELIDLLHLRCSSEVASANAMLQHLTDGEVKAVTGRSRLASVAER